MKAFFCQHQTVLLSTHEVTEARYTVATGAVYLVVQRKQIQRQASLAPAPSGSLAESGWASHEHTEAVPSLSAVGAYQQLCAAHLTCTAPALNMALSFSSHHLPLQTDADADGTDIQ